MKKSTLISAVLASMVAAPSINAENLLVNKNYDFNAWENNGILELFLKVADEGRQFPTEAEFKAAGVNLIDLEFTRSHTRLVNTLDEKKVVSSVPSDRQMWFDVPTGQGKETAGHPSGEFHSDVFTGWNYTAIQGGWNHSMFTYPGSWTATAHKHGTRVVGGTWFFDSTGGDSSQGTAWQDHMKKFGTKNSDGTYKYKTAIVNALLFFGIDGFQYNMEAGTCFSSYNSTEKEFREFWREVRKELTSRGAGSFVGAYQPNSAIYNANTAQYYVGSKEEGPLFEVFLNYSSSAFGYSTADNSYKYCYDALGSGHGVYQGVWYNSLNGRNWAEMQNKQIDIVPWGEHSVSRLYEFVRSSTTVGLQDRYQIITERFMSGGNRNPLNRPTLSNYGNVFEIASEAENDKQLATWGGIASMLPERAALKQDLPFNSYFSLGNGEFYFYKGKKTAGTWYNMGQQDFVPTYRWLVTPVNNNTTASTAVDVVYDHRDAYMGGNALKFSHNSSGAEASADIVIYRCELKANGPVKATLAVKNGKEGTTASHMKLILKKKDSNNWIEVPYGNLSGKTWETKTIDVAGLGANDVIEYVGIRMEGMETGESIYLGQLLLDDNRTIACAPIDATSVEYDKKEEYSNLCTFRMRWLVNDAGYDCPDKAAGNVFNDDVNIDHFEVFYKDGANGTAREISRTATWCAMVPAFDLTKIENDLYLGVRSVSLDLKTASPVVWTKVELDPNAEEKVIDPYAASFIDQGSDSWQTGCATRWLEVVKTTGATGNIDYFNDKQLTFPTDPLPGYLRSDQKLTIAPGEKVTFHVQGHAGNDDTQYLIFKAYIDYDCNGDFYGDDECIFTIGQANHGAAYPDGESNRTTFVSTGFDIDVTIPADVAPGTSRLRFVGSDAWKSHPGPAGGTAKGNTQDFDVEILDKGQDARGAGSSYVDLQDEGEAEDPLPVGVEDIYAGDANMSVYPAVTSDVLNFNGVEKAYIYNVAGQLVKTVAASGSVSVADLANGVYVVKMVNGNATTSAKIVKK